MSPVVDVDSLSVTFGPRRRPVYALDDVSYSVAPGEVLGLVGESGSGKSTIAKVLMSLVGRDAGQVLVTGRDPGHLTSSALTDYWSSIQMVFQDPTSSLNPRRTAAEAIRMPLERHGRGTPAEREERVADLMSQVGLDLAHHGQRRPSELSGGQCQRVAIARAMALGPKVLICDEPVSALDMSVQAQILNVLNQLRAEHELTMVFISHDLAVVRAVADRVAVLYRGRMCEMGDVDSLYARPRHPYTRLLLDSIPGTGRAHSTEARVPARMDLTGAGCAFAHRCARASGTCDLQPDLVASSESPTHQYACHHPLT